MKTRRISLTDVKKWEKRAADFWNKVYVYYDDDAPEITKEEAKELQDDIYTDGISFEYGQYDMYDERQNELLDYYTPAALDYLINDYDSDLTYWGMRRQLKRTYFVGDDSDYFDVNF